MVQNVKFCKIFLSMSSIFPVLKYFVTFITGKAKILSNFTKYAHFLLKFAQTFGKFLNNLGKFKHTMLIFWQF